LAGKIDSKGTRTAISVAPTARKVHLPSSEKLAMRRKKRALTPKKVQALIAHEIGTHAVRAVNGERARVKILGAGLDRYVQGEEGLATYREQQENPVDDYAGLDGYFAIGLAKGLDDGTKKDFTQVFNRLVDYYLVTEETTEKNAKELAWNCSMRVFRGTTGTVPGVVFSKDLAYRQGNIAHWNAVKNESLSGIDLDSGKFDPTNPRHVAFLENLKKLNSEVEKLETKDS
jgi:hypothetical protein